MWYYLLDLREETHPVKRSDVLNTLDEFIQSRSILDHPFYVAWERGELTPEQLATYARMYYPHVQAFPGYLKAVIKCSNDAETRKELSENLADELSEPKTHPELWLDFAQAVGVNREQLKSEAPADFTRSVIADFTELTNRNVASGLSALYAYESQQPEVSKRKMEGLRELYGVRSSEALEYFETHATADVEHREGERKALARCLASGVSEDVIFDSASDALDAYWKLLDGVCEAAGVRAID